MADYFSGSDIWTLGYMSCWALNKVSLDTTSNWRCWRQPTKCRVKTFKVTWFRQRLMIIDYDVNGTNLFQESSDCQLMLNYSVHRSIYSDFERRDTLLNIWKFISFRTETMSFRAQESHCRKIVYIKFNYRNGDVRGIAALANYCQYCGRTSASTLSFFM
jgi:hypothetical protein